MSKPKAIVSAKSLAKSVLNDSVNQVTKNIENTLADSEKLISESTEKTTKAAQDNLKCLLKTCDCCTDYVEDLKKQGQENLKRNVENITQISYKMLKCSNIGDFLDLQQHIVKLNIDNCLNNYIDITNFITNIFKDTVHQNK